MTNTETKRKIYGYTDFATAIRWLNNNYNEFSVALKYDKKLKAIFDKKYNDGYTTPYLSDCSDTEVQYRELLLPRRGWSFPFHRG